ncbi:MAG: MG2 domain-containing protein [Saprospiraceae bacterium]|nr:MG2 domain-containing protein [Saprospiraceae bacterium]
MKTLLFTLSTLLFSTSAFSMGWFKHEFPDYDKAWEKVEEFESKGQYRSALDQVKEIVRMAESDDNHPQLIKTFLFQVKYHHLLEEDAWVAVFELAEATLMNAGEPEKQVYHSIIAELYHTYLNQNQWQISQVDQVKPQPEDFRQWASEDFRDKIEWHYTQSLKGEETLTAARSDYKAILQEGKRCEDLWPSLKDVLFYRSFDYFQSVANQSRFNNRINSEWFRIGESFYSISFKDESLDYFTEFVEQLKGRLAYFYKNNDPANTIHLELRKLRVAFDQTGLGTEYAEALNTLATEFRDHEMWSEIRHSSAEYQLSNLDENGDVNYPLVKDICQEVIDRFPDSYGADECRALLRNRIMQPRLTFSYEEVNLPDQPFRILVQYKNISSVEIEYVEVPPGTQHYEQQKPYRDRRNLEKESWTQHKSFKLPAYEDHNDHSIELDLPALSPGEYLIRLKGQPVDHDELIKSWGYILVSDIGFFTARDKDYNRIFLVDRKEGRPLKNAEATLYHYVYNESTRRNEEKIKATGQSNADGSFVLPKDNNSHSMVLRIQYGGEDVYFTNERIHGQSRNYTESKSNRALIYSDRSIYKPGQTVNFKGIVYSELGGNKELIKNDLIEVELLDANGQGIDKKSLKSNVFGSISGSFRIPEDVLPGEFRIVTRGEFSGQTEISVENYVRPNIEANFLPVEENYALGDTIALDISAQTFYGVPLHGATVRYEISRQVIIPTYARFGFYQDCYFPWPREKEVIASGETMTDEQGSAEITFHATEKGQQKYGIYPWNTFIIEVEVIDQTGEPTTTSKSMTLSNSRIMADISGSTERDVAETDDLVIRFKNFDDQPLGPEGAEIRISELLPNGKSHLRDRYWPTPDQFYYDSSEFKALFPMDPYREEHNPVNWNTRSLITKEVDGESQIVLNNLYSFSEAGLYELKIVDTLTGTAIFSKVLTIYDTSEGLWPDGAKEITVSDKSSYSKGGNKVHILTNLPEGHIWHKFHSRSSVWQTDHSVTVDLKESDRDNAGIAVMAVRDNRVYQHHARLPFNSKKNLRIEILGVNNEVEPGSKQKWTIRTVDDNGRPASAEVAISVFDAALDIYRKHAWNVSPLTSVNKPYFLSVNEHSFGQNAGRNQSFEYDYYDYEHRQLPTLKNIYDLMPAYPYPRAMQRNDVNGVMLMESKSEDERSKSLEEEIEMEPQSRQVDLRKDLAELAYWNATIRTNEEGTADIEFTMKEDLTRWRILALAHDQAIRGGVKEYSTITAKDLTIQPFIPEFLRSGDEILITAKVSNTTNNPIACNASLKLSDPFTGTSWNDWISNGQDQNVVVEAHSSVVVRWMVGIPLAAKGSFKYEMKAVSEDADDGVTDHGVIRSQRVEAIETHSFFLKPGETKTINVDDLGFYLPGGSSSNTSFQLEVVSGPEWYTIQSIPYLARTDNNSIGSVAAAYYVNTMGQYLIKTHPWIEESIASLVKKSPLVRNENYKLVTAQLSPWQREAIQETDQMAMLEYYLDQDKVSGDLEELKKIISERQMQNGGFSWMPEGRDNWYMSQSVLEVLTNLLETTGDHGLKSSEFQALVAYCSARLSEYYDELEKSHKLTKYERPTSIVVHQLYVMAKLISLDQREEFNDAERFFLNKAIESWTDYPLYMQALIAHTAYHQKGHLSRLNDMMRSFEERLIDGGDRGLFWKHEEATGWSENYLLAHSALMQLFHAYGKNEQWLGLTTFLIQNKRTHRWRQPRASIAAIRALLLSTWENKGNLPLSVDINGSSISLGKMEPKTLYQASDLSQSVHPGNGTKITVKNPNDKVAWGSLSWRYEDFPSEIPEFQSRQLSLDQMTLGKKDEILIESDTFNIGDRVFIQLIINSDRSMEYVVVEDDRAAGLHPGIQLSGWQWASDLSFYKAINELDTKFYIEQLPRGKHVIQYEMTASHSGHFTSGISSVQSLYTPEFGGHTNGRVIKIQKRETD